MRSLGNCWETRSLSNCWKTRSLGDLQETWHLSNGQEMWCPGSCWETRSYHGTLNGSHDEPLFTFLPLSSNSITSRISMKLLSRNGTHLTVHIYTRPGGLSPSYPSQYPSQWSPRRLITYLPLLISTVLQWLLVLPWLLTNRTLFSSRLASGMGITPSLAYSDTSTRMRLLLNPSKSVSYTLPWVLLIYVPPPILEISLSSQDWLWGHTKV